MSWPLAAWRRVREDGFSLEHPRRWRVKREDGHLYLSPRDKSVRLRARNDLRLSRAPEHKALQLRSGAARMGRS